MAGKPLNRLELRRQSEAAEPLDPMEDETEELVEEVEEEDVPERKPKKKPKAAPKAKAKSSRAAKPAARMRIVWTVMNDAYKAVATFEYTQKEAAEARAAELTAKGAGLTSCSAPRNRCPRTPRAWERSFPATKPLPRKQPPSKPRRPSRTMGIWTRKKTATWKWTRSRKTKRIEPIDSL